MQLGHHIANPAAHGADARTLGIDARFARYHSDLGTVTGLARDRRDLDRTRSDLGNLEREQLLHQAGMRAGQRDRRAPEPLLDVQDVALEPLAVHIALTWDLLGRRQYRLDSAQVDKHCLGVLALLYDPGDDVALLTGELAERQLVLGVSQALQDDLPGGGRRDPAKTGRSVVIFGQHR